MQDMNRIDYAFKTKLVLFFLVLTVTGCTTIHTEIDEPIKNNGEAFTEGETSIGDVLGEIGPPGKIGSLGGSGVVFLYEYVSVTEYQIGASPPGDLLRWFKISVAKAKNVRQVLLLTFDEEGFLSSREYHESDENLGSGVGLNFLYNIVSLVDYSQLESQPEILDWGNGLLKPLPEALNTMNSFDNGEGGVEQKGTPSKIGQRTLEMREGK